MLICIAQINATTGDIKRNKDVIISHYYKALIQDADLIIFPELSISGYGIMDLARNNFFLSAVASAIEELRVLTCKKKCAILVGAPIIVNEEYAPYNAGVFIFNGEIVSTTYKHHLPNYGIFAEKRNFISGTVKQAIIQHCGVRIGILICEDMWHDDVAKHRKEDGADLLIAINASPFTLLNQKKRMNVAQKCISNTSLPLVYVNRFGGDDEIVFDGGSFALSKSGNRIFQERYWHEELLTIHYDKYNCDLKAHNNSKQNLISDCITEEENIYSALIIGLRDYIYKNNFKKILIGLSGGIDSAFTAILAADAIGADAIQCIYMPSMFSSKESRDDAEKLSQNINCLFRILSIDKIYKAFQEILNLNNTTPSIAEENLQARIRGAILMTISNQENSLLLATSNKSESAVGYCTLYGDMCGGFAPIKDLYKTDLYRIAKWRNKNIPKITKDKNLCGIMIPNNIITKEPSAELKPNQKDSDTLPPYPILDTIIKSFLCCTEAFKVSHIEQNLEKAIKRQINLNQFKRKQAALGTRISDDSFIYDIKHPITNKFF
ncbi:MAG: NAD+ synthase [Proteobacteria bacterium]|nr:NAD+ synthase [Pseudomonadota bacterium]